MVIFDFETGGIKPENPNIQLAAIAVDDRWNEVDAFESKICFDAGLCEPVALEINHYSAEAWKDAPSSSEVFYRFCNFLKRHADVEMTSKRGNQYKVARIAAYNASFDKDRLWAMADGEFVPAHPQAMCIMQRAVWYSHENKISLKSFRLSEVAAHLGINCEGAHEAMADVRMAAEVARKITLTGARA